MTRIQLTINGTTRWIDALQYEYFNPVCKSEKKYRKTLQKNFPYDFGDDRDLFPYSAVTLPTLTTDALAKRLSDDAKWETRIYDPRFRNTSIFRERKSKKDLYYDRLTELRYNKGLDRDIIPNIHNLYDMETRPSNSRDFPDIGRVIGGIFELEFDSTDDDDFFYQWLLSGTMNNGEMVFYKGDYEDQFIKIKFWDCYCTEIEERMSSVDYSPMKMKMRISPAITENRGIKHKKSWKVTEIVNKPFKPEPYAPPIPLVTAAKGEQSALPHAEVEYQVTDYNTHVSPDDRKGVKWVVEVDGKQEIQKQQGEKIKLTINEEWAGKEITVMPYLKTPTEKVSVKTEIQNTKHYKVIPSLGSVRKNFDLPSQMDYYTINRRKTNEITIQRLEKKIPFHSAVVELGIKKITNDYNTRFNNGFPDDYYNEFGRYITELLIYKHQQIKLKTPIDEALNEVVKLIDNENGFNNGLGAPLFHIYENVVRKNDDTGFDKLLHFMFSAKHAHNLNPTISKSLGVAKELIKDEMYSWINDDEKGWDDLDMKANEKGIEYGTELKSR